MRCLLLALFSISSFVAIAQTADEIKLKAAVISFHQALIKKNTATINQVTDKALSYGHSNGWVESKNDMMKNLESGYIGYQNIETDSMQVQMNSNVANVRFNAIINATLKGNPEKYVLKVLEVWMKKGNRWILFARQSVKNKWVTE